jgi:hypothetical protein
VYLLQRDFLFGFGSCYEHKYLVRITGFCLSSNVGLFLLLFDFENG